MATKLVGVVMGGDDFEGHISLSTGDNVVKIINNNLKGYKAVPIIFSKDIDIDIRKLKPDIIFNAMHGKFGEDGRLAAYLDMIQIPYTHSGYIASGIGMNKSLAKRLISTLDIAVAPDVKLSSSVSNKKEFIRNKIKAPYLIKPIGTGTSIGIKFVDHEEYNLENYPWDLFREVIIEEYIKGPEFTVLILNDKPVGVLEISIDNNAIFDYHNKINFNPSHYIMPPQSISFNGSKYQELIRKSLEIYKLLGCKDICRIDFILNSQNNEFTFLEINTHPGLINLLSLSIKIANWHGIGIQEIIETLLINAKFDKPIFILNENKKLPVV